MNIATFGVLVGVTIAFVFYLIGWARGRAGRDKAVAQALEADARNRLASAAQSAQALKADAQLAVERLRGLAASEPAPGWSWLPAPVEPPPASVRVSSVSLPGVAPLAATPQTTPQPAAELAPLLVQDSGRHHKPVGHHKSVDPLGIATTQYLPQVRPRTQETNP